MPGLAPGIPDFLSGNSAIKTWMAGTSPAMTAHRLARDPRRPHLHPMPSSVHDNPERHRFELTTAAGPAFASYRRDDAAVTIMHTEVPRALEGQGIGSTLVAGTLDLIRAEGRKVVPLCSFVRHFIKTHPDYADLVR